MFDILDDPFADLATTRTVLVELRYAVYLVRASIRKTFPSLAFAAKLNVDSRSDLLRSLDDSCFERIHEATKYTMESGYCFTDYEADRYVVWTGLDDAKLPLSTLSDRDVKAQLELMERRGCLDRIRVHMAIEVDVEGGAAVCRDRDEGSVGSVESMQTVETVQTVEAQVAE
ncbi:hypothetical protein CONLIGDRAFT_676869 [Coniochaeta ligniaria NRRL 30616]|uniref:Uncharacterized protein n=1 Tax=Coniochaeta ligniaria NRRL 30616 TaxID=1408157 RepID=A0A1J7J102_9PEZI|nr:hypothetical protein CONLIGDRAFT_676869 [Coniochaeta ligniaria NRRL 30616]